MVQTEAPSTRPAAEFGDRSRREILLTEEDRAMTDLDKKVIEKILTSEEAMQIAKEFIQKHRVSSQAPVSDPPAYPDKP